MSNVYGVSDISGFHENINWQHINFSEFTPRVLVTNNSKEDYMNIYDVLIVNKKDFKVVYAKENIIAQDQQQAMFDIEVNKLIKEEIKEGVCEIFWTQKHCFKKYKEA